MTFSQHNPDRLYRLYGLTIRSNLPLLYLHSLPPSAQADVEITFHPEIPPALNLGAESERRFQQTFLDQATLQGWHTPDGILLVYTAASDTAHILIDSSGSIRVSHSPALPLENLLPILYGTALSLSLHIMGMTCLHASAVAAHDQAILFVGASGIGKSTLAAALVERGLQFVTDDLAVLAETPHRPTFALQPGANAVRLWSDTSRKHWQTFPAAETALPIRRIYLLGTTSDQPGIFPLSKRDAFLALAQHRYASALQPTANQPRSLERLRRLIDQVPIQLLRRSPDLPATVSCIERDLQATFQAHPE